MKKRFEFIKKNKNSIEITRKPISDNRGLFERLFCKKEFKNLIKEKNVVQINRAYTKSKATIRGMHYQVGNTTEDKIVTCLKGRVFDVIIDARKDSKNFLKWYSCILDSKNNTSSFVPHGFAHGYQTLTNNCELIYFHTDYYDKGASRIINCFDPIVNIKWPLKFKLVSKKDMNEKFIKKPLSEYK